MSGNKTVWVVLILIVAALIGGYGLYLNLQEPGKPPVAVAPTPAPVITPAPMITPAPIRPKVIEPAAAVADGPGWKIEAEDYDEGGEGVGYHDTTKGNNFQNRPGEYRADDVDIESKNPGQLNVGRVGQGEWLAYTTDVPKTGMYDLDLNVATQVNDRRMHLELDGQRLPETIYVPNTGDWGLFQVIAAPGGLSLTQGKHTLKLVFDTQNINVDWLRFVPLSTGWEQDAGTLTVQAAWEPSGRPAPGTTVSLHGNAADQARWRFTAATDDRGQVAVKYPAKSAGELGHLQVSHAYAVKGLTQDLTLTGDAPFIAQLQHATTLFGKVVMAPGKTEPVEGARVRLLGTTQWTHVGAGGAFEFFGVGAKEQRPIAIRDPLCSFASVQEIESLNVLEGQRNGPVELVLKDGPLLSGRVLDSTTGQPVFGVSVSLVQQGGVGTRQQVQGETDADGAYNLAGLFGDRYEAELTATGYATSKLIFNQTRSKRITRDFKLEPGADVTVTVQDATGQPLPEARIYLYQDNRSVSHPERTDAAGRVVIAGISRKNPPQFRGSLTGYSYQSRVTPTFAAGGKTGTVKLVMTPTASGTTTPKEYGYFMGRVTDKAGKAVAGATVKWGYYYNLANTKEQATTEADGGYELTATMASGRSDYVLAVQAPGYAPAWQSTIQPGKTLEPKTADFQLDPGHWLEVTVTEEDGAPIPNARVSVRASTNDNMQHYDLPGQPNNLKTDQQGRLRLENLPGPSVNLSCSATGWTSTSQQKVALDAATKVVMLPTGVILGRVLDKETKKPIADFMLKKSSNEKGELISDLEGRFELKGLSLKSSYSIALSAEGYPAMTATQVTAERTNEAQVRDFFLAPGKALTLKLVDAATQKAVAGATVVSALLNEQYRSYGHRSVQWEELNSNYNHYYQDFQREITDAAGQVMVQEGEAQRTFFLNTPGYQRLLLEPAERTKFKTAAGVLTVPLAVGGQLSGVLLKDGKPRPNTRISLNYTRGNSSESFGAATTDANGKYRFDGLADGQYRLSPYERSGNMSYNSLSLTATLANAEKKTLNIGEDLGPHALSGAITEDGSALMGASVRLTNQFDWEYSNFSNYSDGDGKYRIAGLRPGRYSLYVSWNDNSGENSRSRQTTIDVKGDLEKSFDLSKGKKLTGRLAFPATMPAEKRARYSAASLYYRGQEHQLMNEEGYDQNRQANLQDGKFEFMGRFKGKYQLQLTYRLTESQTKTIQEEEIEVDNLAADSDIGEIKVRSLGSIVVRLAFENEADRAKYTNASIYSASPEYQRSNNAEKIASNGNATIQDGKAEFTGRYKGDYQLTLSGNVDGASHSIQLPDPLKVADPEGDNYLGEIKAPSLGSVAIRLTFENEKDRTLYTDASLRSVSQSGQPQGELVVSRSASAKIKDGGLKFPGRFQGDYRLQLSGQSGNEHLSFSLPGVLKAPDAKADTDLGEIKVPAMRKVRGKLTFPETMDAETRGRYTAITFESRDNDYQHMQEQSLERHKQVNITDGKFELTGRYKGKYRLTASYRQQPSRTTSVQLGEFDVDNLAADADLGDIKIPGIGSVVVRLVFERESDREKYQNASLQPLNPVDYNGPNPDNLTRYGSANIQDGKLEFVGRFKGEYRLHLSGGQGSSQSTMMVSQVLKVANPDGANALGEIKVPAIYEVRGKLVLREPLKPAGVRLMLRTADTSRMAARGAANPEGLSYYGDTAPDDEGNFVFSGRFKGEYLFSFRQSDSGRSSTVQLPKLHQLDNLAANQELGELKAGAMGEFRLKLTHRDPARKPAREMMAMLLDEKGQTMPEGRLEIRADQDEQTVGPLAEGTHKIRFLAIGFKIEPPEVTVTIGPGQAPEVSVTTIPDGMWYGSVRGDDGSIPEVSRITLTGNGENRTLTPTKGTEMDAMKLWSDTKDVAMSMDGRMVIFLIRGLKKGEYQITIEAAGYEKYEQTRQVEPGSPDMRESNIRLKKAGAATPTP